MGDSKPDWENFAKAVLTEWPTGDLEGSVLFDLSLEYGMIQEVPGGYNSDHHIDAEGICPEEGDPWYEYTFRGEAGPGLYSIADMNKRIEELEAEQIEWVKRLADDLIAAEGREARLKDKLAKAVEALEGLVELHSLSTNEINPKTVLEDAYITLAELTGGKDEPMQMGI